MSYQSFEDLAVWQRGCRLAVDVFKLYGDCASYALRDQAQRASLSIPSNIAEGHERDSKKEFLRFLNIAQGSCGELRTQLYISRKLELINPKDFEQLKNESKEISAMLRGLSRAINKQINVKSKKLKTEP
ncbi:MAG: four helix bundle protein [Verrucomicrobiales bacterium]|jgi:four helix bundle protein|nr:four helix bundle protein [Verrucomicrobiales bacterium]